MAYQPQQQMYQEQQPAQQTFQPPMYQAQQPMQQTFQQPAFHQDNGGEWKSNLCDCTPCSSCIVSCVVPCLLVGETSERLRDPSMQTKQDLNNDCMIHGALCAFTGFHWVYTMIKRTEIRERFGIPGSTFGDCCTSYWCHCCAVIQQDNEVKKRLHYSGPVQQQYQQQPAMVVPQAPQPSHTPSQKEGYTQA